MTLVSDKEEKSLPRSTGSLNDSCPCTDDSL